VVSWKKFAIVADANTAVGYTRYLANDYSFTPVLVIISEPIFRQEDKKRIIKEIQDLEYAKPPKVLFLADQYEINQAIREEEEVTLLVGSSNEREVALEKEIQFLLGAFPVNERLIFNRTYAGYKGSLTFTEDLYDNL
ncbi:MAG: nitrogen fixation protein NifK, partial [Lachnospiraceae bacterium]|nr:nitrogen fixation protein NifK [Lachnospiraceae bacterium]